MKDNVTIVNYLKKANGLPKNWGVGKQTHRRPDRFTNLKYKWMNEKKVDAGKQKGEQKERSSRQTGKRAGKRGEEAKPTHKSNK